MDEQFNTENQPVNPRRRKRSKLQEFKEDYLPLAIAAVAVLLILIFIIGSITRAVQRNRVKNQAQQAASSAAAENLSKLNEEAQLLCEEASLLAASFDYDAAIAKIESFSGTISEFSQLNRLYQQYLAARDELVVWDDPAKIPLLSVQLLIAEPERAFTSKQYGSSYLSNFITTEEFSRMLQQMYENGYILIDVDDITDGTEITPLSLPADKKPFMLTQTQVNYYTYMTDSDGDKMPDKGGSGFASKLIVDANANLTCEFITAEGETVTGAYDMVPILESFIATHPDFSYRGARATLAVTGYDGIFGYRINAKAKNRLGAEKYQQEVDQATEVVKSLRNAGYTIACCTYENAAYGSYTASQIENDLTLWETEIAPVVGVVDTLVYARNSDIASATADYIGTKYDALENFGFYYYQGFSTKGEPWLVIGDSFVRQGRILVTGSNLKSRAGWFTGIFNPEIVLDPIRDNYTS